MGSTSSSANAVPAKWDAKQIPSLAGKVVIVTGANSGIGYVAALEMAKHGAHVVLACRNEERGKEAEKKIQNELLASGQSNTSGGEVEFMQLDVGSLGSVGAFAEKFQATHDRLDILVNNAGIFGVPHALTVDGIESQFATNHLGHFALTAQLLGLLKKSAPSRVINTSSVLHRDAKFDVNEIVTPKEKYKSLEVYCNTKLYNLLFTAEMDRRLRAKNVHGVMAVTAHPGLTDTSIFGGPGQSTSKTERFMKVLARWTSQHVEMGVLPTLYAATAPGVRGGDYYGPNGFRNFSGYPTLEEPKNDSKSAVAAEKLWQESERLAKLSFEI